MFVPSSPVPKSQNSIKPTTSLLQNQPNKYSWSTMCLLLKVLWVQCNLRHDPCPRSAITLATTNQNHYWLKRNQRTSRQQGQWNTPGVSHCSGSNKLVQSLKGKFTYLPGVLFKAWPDPFSVEMFISHSKIGSKDYVHYKQLNYWHSL